MQGDECMKKIIMMIGVLILLVGSFTIQVPNVKAVDKNKGLAKLTNGKITTGKKTLKITWKKDKQISKYAIYKAGSKYATKKKIATTKKASFTDKHPGKNHYANYYKVVGLDKRGKKKKQLEVSLNEQLFGESMVIFSPQDDQARINKKMDAIYKKQKDAQFGPDRFGVYFLPGDYTKGQPNHVYNIGYYTSINGLGAVPTQTKLANVASPAALPDNNGTCNFWISMENFQITNKKPTTAFEDQFNYGASQAAPLRRMQVDRPAELDWHKGWVSGGFISDSVYKQKVGSETQQQYYVRNSQLDKSWYGTTINGVLQGTKGAPTSNWEQSPEETVVTNIKKTPVVREKPFLYLNNQHQYKVFVPGLQKNTAGVTWKKNSIGKGKSLDLKKNFYVAKASKDNATTLNKALKQGKNLFFTPGVYKIDQTLKVTKPNTVILGTGLATLENKSKGGAIKVADVDGVTLAGLLIDQETSSKTFVQIGDKNAHKNHKNNPTLLTDVFLRVGGTKDIKTSANTVVEVNSNDVIGDDLWIWRADHSQGVGWTKNETDYGMIVNGDRVTMYGLFNEHHQKYQLLWNGEYGSTYFYQSESPYDPQKQSDWMSHNGKVKGYASYKVSNQVKHHLAQGIGVYGVFVATNGAPMEMENGVEVPNRPDVKVINACTIELGGSDDPDRAVNHVINGTGISTKEIRRPFILKYVNGKSTLPDGSVVDGK